MPPVLTVFIDGLKPESLKHMKFVSSFNVRRIKTELINYSNTCHASMYTGVYPSKHQIQFIWKFSPETSPFNLLKRLGIHKFPHNLYSKFMAYAVISLLSKKRIILHGFRSLAKQPLSRWSLFDFEVVKYWGRPNSFLGKYPTIFNILKRNRIKYKIIWMTQGSLRRIKFGSQFKPWTYLFIGQLEIPSHKYGQDSLMARKLLEEIDKNLEDAYRKFEKKFGDFYFMVFSDHGHVKVESRIDLYQLFKSAGKDLNNYIHFIDAVHARFWFENDKQKSEVEEILSRLCDKGFILTKEILKKYHSDVPDNRYGDLIFYLDKPYVFDVVDPKTKSMHGYLPDYPDCDGVFVSNKEIKKKVIILQDIAPSILQALELEIPDYMDGEPVWK